MTHNTGKIVFIYLWFHITRWVAVFQSKQDSLWFGQKYLYFLFSWDDGVGIYETLNAAPS